MLLQRRAEAEKRKKGVCFAFQRGKCSRGDACRFSHSLDDDDDDNDDPRSKESKRVRGRDVRRQVLNGTAASKETDVRDAVTPLWKQSYDEQVQWKQGQMEHVLKTLSRKARKCSMDRLKAQKRSGHKPKAAVPEIPSWANAPKIEGDSSLRGMACPLEPILPSPSVSEYRNKCEFALGKSADGSKRTAGFRCGSFAATRAVAEPKECSHVAQPVRALCASFDEFLAESPFDTYELVTREGVWRQLTVRQSSRTGDCVVMIQVCPPSDDAKEQWEAERARLVSWCKSQECLTITGLLLQAFTGVSNPAPDHPFEILLGSSEMVEECMGCRFRISPGAFFQTNTAAAEVLFKKVAEFCRGESSEPTTLYDICCGTGTIGISLVKSGELPVASLVGVEMCASAVENAKRNASDNAISNATFVAAKAEEVLREMLQGSQPHRVVAVVDPPRSGLAASVVRALRRCRAIQRLVYVSCTRRGPSSRMRCA